jgi:hypothetical protein
MENLWAMVNHEVRHRDPQTHEELVRVVNDEIGKVSRDTIRTLLGSMHRRLSAVIMADGGWTKY